MFTANTNANTNTRPIRLSERNTFALQKCILPNAYFSDNLPPGALVKCLNENNEYCLCTAYCAIDEEYYVDACVGTENFRPTALSRIEALPMSDLIQRELDAVVVVSEDIFNNFDDVAELLESLAEILALFYLFRGCYIQRKNLRDMGILSIQVASGPKELDKYFKIASKSSINIIDVKLKQIKLGKYFELNGFQEPMEELKHLLRTGTDKCPSLLQTFQRNALLIGCTGSGKSALVKMFLRHNDCNCFRINVNEIPQYAGEAELVLRQIFNSACKFHDQLMSRSPTVILLDDIQKLGSDVKINTRHFNDSQFFIKQLLELIHESHTRNSNIVCLATTDSLYGLNHDLYQTLCFKEISISNLSEAQRRNLFSALSAKQLPNLRLSEELIDFVAKNTHGYVAANMLELIQNIANMCLMKEKTSLKVSIEQALDQVQHTSVNGIGNDIAICKPKAGFEAIAGMDTLKNVFRNLFLTRLKTPSIYGRCDVNLTKGILLYGPPGCAKTTFAKCLAKEAKMTFISTCGAEIYSPYVGGAEKYVAEIFQTARRNEPCLIFFDEIDSLFGRRVIGLTDAPGCDIQSRILQTLLTEMDGIVKHAGGVNSGISNAHLLVVGATNRPDMIDDALMRPGRFDKLIHVPPPDEMGRIHLLREHAQRMRFSPMVDLAKIAIRTENYSGADLCNICNEVGLTALQRNINAIEISEEDFEEVLSRQKSSLTRDQINFYYDFEGRVY